MALTLQQQIAQQRAIQSQRKADVKKFTQDYWASMRDARRDPQYEKGTFQAAFAVRDQYKDDPRGLFDIVRRGALDPVMRQAEMTRRQLARQVMPDRQSIRNTLRGEGQYEGDLSYALRKPTSVQDIASKHGMSVEQLVAMNPRFAGKQNVLAGDVVRVTGEGRSFEDAALAEQMRYDASNVDSEVESLAEMRGLFDERKNLRGRVQSERAKKVLEGAPLTGDPKARKRIQNLNSQLRDIDASDYRGIAALGGGSLRRGGVGRLMNDRYDDKAKMVQAALDPRTAEELRQLSQAGPTMPPMDGPQSGSMVPTMPPMDGPQAGPRFPTMAPMDMPPGLGGFLQARQQLQSYGMLPPPPSPYPQQVSSYAQYQPQFNQQYQPQFNQQYQPQFNQQYQPQFNQQYQPQNSFPFQPQMQGGKGSSTVGSQFVGF
jgi:hypothetical protein